MCFANSFNVILPSWLRSMESKRAWISLTSSALSCLAIEPLLPFSFVKPRGSKKIQGSATFVSTVRCVWRHFANNSKRSKMVRYLPFLLEVFAILIFCHRTFLGSNCSSLKEYASMSTIVAIQSPCAGKNSWKMAERVRVIRITLIIDVLLFFLL